MSIDAIWFYMMLYDDSIWCYMMMLYDAIWWFKMMIQDDAIWWCYMMMLYDDSIWWCYGWVCDGLSISSALVWKLIDLIGGELPTQWAPPLMPMGSKSPRVLLNFERRQIWPVHCESLWITVNLQIPQNHPTTLTATLAVQNVKKIPWVLWMWDSRVTTNGVPTAPTNQKPFGSGLVQKRPVANQGRIVFGSFPVVLLVSCQNAVAISAETPLHHPLSDFALAHMTHIERFLSTESTESTGNHIPNGSQSQTCSKSSRSLTTYTSISRQVVTVIMWNMMKYVNTRFKCWCFSHVFTCFHTWNVWNLWNGGMAYQRQPNVPQCRNDARLGFERCQWLADGWGFYSQWTLIWWVLPERLNKIPLEIPSGND